MGELVTVAQAAWLVRRDQRAVRYHIAQQHLAPIVGDDGHMRLDLEAIAAVVGWRIDPARLAELRAEASASPTTLAAQVEHLTALIRAERIQRRELEGRVLELTALVQTLTRDDTAEASPDGQQAAWEYQSVGEGAALSDLPRSASGDVLAHGRGLAPDARHILSRYGPERPVALADRGGGAAVTFRTKTDAARWLVRHGLNSETTPKSWRGWPPDELTPTAVLTFALDVWRDARARGDWRVTWRLRPCDDGGCICHDLLAE